MLKKINNYFASKLRKYDLEKPLIITFTGGMGAQIISASIYFKNLNDGKIVYADLSYFDLPKDLAEIGSNGKSSHWDWQLSPFGMELQHFKVLLHQNNRHLFDVVADGAKKLQLGIDALRSQYIQNLFALPPVNVSQYLPQNNATYLCIHVRRGDYLNVASHITSDADFYTLAKRFMRVVDHAVIVSDSPISAEFKLQINKMFPKTSFLDNINEFETHCVMRNASILVCSNSQFSLIAALLNTTALVALPRVWFGADQPQLEMIVSNLGNFQLL